MLKGVETIYFIWNVSRQYSGNTRVYYNFQDFITFVIGLFSYVFSNTNNDKLVFETFDKALESNPRAKPIFHSDRGFQYTSKQFKFKLDEAGKIQSMSRVVKCIDNGPIEGFCGTLKSESFYGLKFNDEQVLRNKIEEYIFFYNNYRLQKNLKGMTPIQYRHQALHCI